MRLPRFCTRAGSLVLAGAAVLTVAATACTPAQQTGPKTLSGVLRGADGKFVDAMIGFDILDAQGRKIKSNGALVTDGGYGALLRMNWCVGAAGLHLPGKHTLAAAWRHERLVDRG